MKKELEAMKQILILTFTVLLTLLFVSCGKQPEQFSVTMGEMYALHDPIILTVILPDNAKESDITFAIDGTVYSVSSIPTVNDPTFVFEDIAGDGMMQIRLEMASDESESDVLYMLPEDGTAEMCFVATAGDFSRLTAYLGTN